MNKNTVKEPTGGGLSGRKSYVMFKENPLSVGTRHAGTYLFCLCLALSPPPSENSRLATPGSSKPRFNPVRHTRSHVLIELSLLDRVAFFSTFFHRRVRPQNLRFLSSCFLFRAARKIVASSRMLAAEFPLPAPSSPSLLLDEGIPMHKYIRTKRALRAVSVPLNQFLSSPFLLSHPSRYVFRSSAFSLFVSLWLSLFSRALSPFFFHPLVPAVMAIRTFFQFPEKGGFCFLLLFP